MSQVRDTKAFKLSVLMPVYNEQNTIIEAELATPYTKEIVVVDDGSSDGARSILGALNNPELLVFS